MGPGGAQERERRLTLVEGDDFRQKGLVALAPAVDLFHQLVEVVRLRAPGKEGENRRGGAQAGAVRRRGGTVGQETGDVIPRFPVNFAVEDGVLPGADELLRP